MLETSSYGHCENDDLPGNQARADDHSLHFDTAPLEKEMDCFGYPQANLTLSCDKPVASIAVRLCEVSPRTGASHLVSYRFFNLCFRGGDMSDPRPLEPGTPFSVSIPLNILGHTFREGWRIRLSISPSFFPTMWQSPEVPVITLHTGPIGGLPASSLSMPRRAPRAEDGRMRELLPPGQEIACVNSEDYVPTLQEGRAASNLREADPIDVAGKEGVLVHKVFDSGRYQYGGPLQGLWVDEVAEENYQMFETTRFRSQGIRHSRRSSRGPAGASSAIRPLNCGRRNTPTEPARSSTGPRSGPSSPTTRAPSSPSRRRSWRGPSRASGFDSTSKSTSPCREFGIIEEAFDTGKDAGLPASDAYGSPFFFPGLGIELPRERGGIHVRTAFEPHVVHLARGFRRHRAGPGRPRGGPSACAASR